MKLRAFLIAAMAMAAQSSFAGEFSTSCFSTLDNCSAKISDIVTDKFIAHFPASKFKIVVITEFQTYSDGGGVGYAVVGVVPAGKTSLVPRDRFSTTTRITGRSMSGYDVTKETEELMRRAVQNLMAACESSDSCNVYKPY